MSFDPIYINSAIETLELVQQLYDYLNSNNKIRELTDYISQIENKANARITSSLGKTLGMDIPVADQEGKPTEYWKGVRDMAKMASKQWTTLQNAPRFLSFLNKTSNSLYSRVTPEEKTVSPLEEMLQTEAPVTEKVEPVSPLESILSTPTPTPEIPIPEPIPAPIPTPEIPTPEPIPTPIPTPEIPTPEPIPTPIPTPEIPTPEPIPTPIPAPEIPIPEPIPAPTPTPEIPTPISPVTPEAPADATPSDRLQALDEALKTSGLEQPSTESIEPSSSSLADMILAKDETGEKEEEDDMLSLSLREALKILRDEDED
jgi:hypothetical protein